MTDLGVEQDVKEMRENTVITEEQPPPYDDADTTSLLQMILTEESIQDQEQDDMMENLSPLERLIKLSSSPTPSERLEVTREIAATLYQISREEAVDQVVPVILALGKDTDENVRETLASEFDKYMYFFQEEPAHLFSSLLIDFLLDQNTNLASLAQQAIVNITSRWLETPSEKSHALVSNEIHDGILMGLMDIVNGKDESNEREMDEGGVNLAKMVCLMLISALASVVGPQHCTEKFLPLVEEMVNDPMFYVRKEAAAAVGNLVLCVDQDVAQDRLLPLYSKLMKDGIWHCRRACVFALNALCGVLPHDVKTRIAVEGVETFKNDISRNVRNALADIAGELVAKFLPEDWQETGKPGEFPIELLEFFLSIGDASKSNPLYKLDSERIYNCAFSFPAVTITVGVDYWDSHLRDTFLSLTKDYQVKIRRTFAFSLHEIAKIIGPEKTERDLVQIFALYLMDLDDVKQGVLEHLSDFLNALEESSRNEYIPILAEVWDGVVNNWHLREILAGQLRDIAQLFDAPRVVEHILPLALRATQDMFAAVRERGLEVFPIILEIVKRTVDEDGENLSLIEDMDEDEEESQFEKKQKYALAMLNHVMERLDELAKAESYRSRIIFAQICGSLIEVGINTADFTSFFLPRLVSLAADPIVNVRIVVSRMLYILYTSGDYHSEIMEITTSEDEASPSSMLEEITYKLAVDDDADVNFYIHNVLNEEALDAYRQRRQEEKDKQLRQNEQGNESRTNEQIQENGNVEQNKQNEQGKTSAQAEQNEQKSEQSEKYEQSEKKSQGEQHKDIDLTEQPLPSPPSLPQHTNIADEDEIMADKTDHLILSSLDHVVPPSNPKQLVN
ncbi:ARM repeat-containing protein [Backusella circina FSU 941]|nr:ARM repeat-containing protein [Backusella circina FSU 941]